MRRSGIGPATWTRWYRIGTSWLKLSDERSCATHSPGYRVTGSSRLPRPLTIGIDSSRDIGPRQRRWCDCTPVAHALPHLFCYTSWRMPRPADPNPYAFIDLFAGIGGIRIAFERAGARCVFSSEWDGPCQDVYEANFGERPAGDIAAVPSADIPSHDILAGGFPCQAFSIIGDRMGFADTRGTLFFEIERILRDKRPRAFLLENVKQLVTHDRGRTFRTILGKLKALGYHTHWTVLNGLDFGVPQKRERTII